MAGSQNRHAINGCSPYPRDSRGLGHLRKSNPFQKSDEEFDIISWVNSVQRGTIDVFSFMDQATTRTCEEIIARLDSVPPIANHYTILTYGSLARREYMDHSDIDLIILIEDAAKPAFRLEQFQDTLRGLTMGKADFRLCTHSTFSRAYGPDLIKADYARQSCYLWGSRSLLHSACSSFSTQFDERWFMHKILFSYFFLERYNYPLKAQSTGPSLKYARGAMRDIIFLNWYDELDTCHHVQHNRLPHIQQILKRRKEVGDEDSPLTLSDAVQLILLMKNEALRLNFGTSKAGRAFMDAKTASELGKALAEHQLLNTKTANFDVARQYDRARYRIAAEKDAIFHRVIKRLGVIRGHQWSLDVEKTLDGQLDAATRLCADNDPISATLAIWPFLHSETAIHQFAHQSRNTSDWSRLVTLCCSPFCPSKFLHTVVQEQAQHSDFSYLHRLIALNPQTPVEALDVLARINGLDEKVAIIVEARRRDPTRGLASIRSAIYHDTALLHK